jgi:hypothetical protein
MSRQQASAHTLFWYACEVLEILGGRVPFVLMVVVMDAGIAADAAIRNDKTKVTPP